jgi:hypothetical protein
MKINPTPFLNRAKVKSFLLEHAHQTRAQKFTRVSSETLIHLNEIVHQACISHVSRMPSKGKTL